MYNSFLYRFSTKPESRHARLLVARPAVDITMRVEAQSKVWRCGWTATDIHRFVHGRQQTSINGPFHGL